MKIVKNSNKISTLVNLQNNTNVILVSRYGCNGNTHVHHVDPVYVHKFTCLFIDRTFINFLDIDFHLISSELWSSGDNGGLVIWRPCGVGGSNSTVGKIFCIVRLFRVPRSWTGIVQMKSSMTITRGNRCTEREKDNFKSREVKRLKECALALMTKAMTLGCLYLISISLGCDVPWFPSYGIYLL